MAYPEHSRDRFFKYTSASTAVKVLESSAVRYSSPLLFNDPFDVQSGLHFDFDIESLPDKILARVEELMALDKKPNVSEDGPLGKAIILMWEKKAAHGFPREHIREMFGPELGRLKEQVIQLQTQFQHTWWNDFLPRLRVFSVSEEKDNLLMWAHYAENHTGVVFELLNLPEEDNCLCAAEPVLYCNTPPSFFTEEQWLNDILSVQRLAPEELYFQYAYVKSALWAYEKEWRVWDLLPNLQQMLYSDYTLQLKEVGAVYFGCRVASELKAKMMSLLSAKFPDAKLFQARKVSDIFELEFEAI